MGTNGGWVWVGGDWMDGVCEGVECLVVWLCVVGGGVCVGVVAECEWVLLGAG